jgi:hypothetical protein
MRELIVRVSCFVANLILGEPRIVVTEAQEKELALARAGDPYFNAFRERCMQWVYGDDPRRSADA